MDVLKVPQFVDELLGMDVEVFQTAFLTDDPLGAFGVATHVLTDFLVNLAFRVHQTALPHYYYM